MTDAAKTTLTAVKTDANQRTWRTIVQGFIATLIVTVLPIVNTAIGKGVENVDWTALQYSASTAAIMATIAYVMAYVRPALDNDTINKIVDDAVKEAEERILQSMKPDQPAVVNNAVVVVPDPVAPPA